jgi:hypothetical protein
MKLPEIFEPICANWNECWYPGTYDGHGVWTLEVPTEDNDYQAVPTQEIKNWYHLNSK